MKVNIGKNVVNAMYVNVGHVNHSVEREKQNVNVFSNPARFPPSPPVPHLIIRRRPTSEHQESEREFIHIKGCSV